MSKAVVLVAHPRYRKNTLVVQEILRWWGDRGFEVSDASDRILERQELFDMNAEFILSLGGDGTMLRAAQMAIGTDIPLVGINLGRLGYLTQIEPDKIEAYFAKLLEKDFSLEQKITLEVEANGKKFFCLNEVTIEKATPGHTISIYVEISGSRFISYRGDGILIATPTGSTAYNLSLGGPILSPTLEAVTLTPIAPHTLFDRSLVLSCNEKIDVILKEDSQAVLVTDGNHISLLEAGEKISISVGKAKVNIARFPGPSFHEVLRDKFYMNDR